MMEFVITLNKNGQRLYMQDFAGADAYTDDLGHAMIFDDIGIVRNELLDNEKFYPIIRDEDGGIEGIDLNYRH